jgi:CRISPR/Cas system CSM-associated protein Csm4 (group 5 of RAMP superfamily)
MAQDACRLCGQTNKTFGHTIRDKLITEFLSNAVVVSETFLFTKMIYSIPQKFNYSNLIKLTKM